MPKKKPTQRSFVNAVALRGGKIPHMAMGGPMLPTTTVQPLGPVQTKQGGIGGFLTSQNDFQAQLAPTTQVDYTPTMNTAVNNVTAGYGQNNQNIQAGQALMQTAIDRSKGVGPNPAQAALNQNTAANIAGTTAAMAGVRGGSANAGLIARGAGQQGAATQQQAVGQAATLQAQQQIAAEQEAAGLQGQIGGQILNEQAINNNLFGSTIAGNNGQNANLVTNYGNAQAINAGIGQQNAQAANSGVGGLLGGIASGIAALFAEGGEVAPPVPSAQPALMPAVAGSGPKSSVGKFLAGATAKPASPAPTMSSFDTGMQNLGSAIGKSVHSSVLTASQGVEVPGQATVGGDSLQNDTVPAMLSPGEIVLPRHVTQAPDAPKRAAAFVQAIKAKQGLKRRK